MKPPIKKCPYCGHDYGFYTKDYVAGPTTYNYCFDGTEADNSEFYSPLKHEQSKYAYCAKCDKRLFKIEDCEAE